MSSAQLDTRHELPPEGPDPNSGSDSLFALKESVALKEEVAARLAAHRARRQRSVPAAPAPIPIASPARARAARIAATVAERYAHSESYRSFLAAEAQTAIRQAEAAAEVAAVTARAVAEAQLNLLEELDNYSADKAQEAADQVAVYVEDAATPATIATPGAVPVSAAAPVAPQGPITIRLYEEVGPGVRQAFTTSHLHPRVDPMDDEGQALDDEIAFRQAPSFEESVAPTEIPANLIEFPRQLVAARRARPRLAEGPLREDLDEELHSAQLRIFEVEPEQMSAAPAMESAAPEWSSILLDAQPVIAPVMVQAEELETLSVTAPVLMTAPLELRILAAAFDTAIVLAGMLVFATAAVMTIGPIPGLELGAMPVRDLLTAIAPLAAMTGFAFLFLSAVYQWLFFTFSEATPGMRYARIGLCTFSDENPTRRQMRRRILATLVSACPLGLGLVWSWIDTDRLGWHDRISRMYQRSY